MPITSKNQIEIICLDRSFWNWNLLLMKKNILSLQKVWALEKIALSFWPHKISSVLADGQSIIFYITHLMLCNEILYVIDLNSKFADRNKVGFLKKGYNLPHSTKVNIVELWNGDSCGTS